MIRRFRFLLFLGGISLLVYLGVTIPKMLPLLFSEEKQVAYAEETLMNAISVGDWKKVDKHVHEDYEDQWELDKEGVIAVLKQLRGLFFTLEIFLDDPRTLTLLPEGAEDPTEATTSFKPRLTGRGSPIAQGAQERANRMKKPLTLQWKKTGWSPYSWQLTASAYPGLPVSKEILHQMRSGGVLY